MKIESTDNDIRTLLTSGYYKIPRFQRPYSWEREHIQEFWDDIVKENPIDYFIGSMVLYKIGNQYFGVVDGQQRLTTITILLCVLRNELESLGLKDPAQGIHGLIERTNIENKAEFILTTESSYPFFQDHIQKWGYPDVPVTPLSEEKNLQTAYSQLESLIKNVVDSVYKDETLSDDKKGELLHKKLISIRDALLNLKIIVIKLDNEDDAYVIFETLNTRGKDLSLTDLVKNYLTKQLKSKSASIDQTKVKWEKLLETIQGSSSNLETDTFIHHFWLSKYDYLPAKKVFKTLKKQIAKAKSKDFLDALVADAHFYRAIHETEYGKWSKQERRIEEALSALILFKVQQQTPCVLSLVREFKNKKIKKKHIEDALIAIEKFHFLFTSVTSQRSSGGISVMYAALARRLSYAKDTQEAVEVIRNLKQKMRDRVPSDREFLALFPEIIYTENFTKQRSLVKYILVGLAKLKQKSVVIDYDHMTIEHLAPQSLIGFGDYNDSVIGQLGNLILVSEELNGKLKDKSFKQKKKILANEGYELADEVLEASDWGSDEIVERTKQLAQISYDTVWKI